MDSKQFHYDVFVSYSSDDDEWVNNAINLLEVDGYKICAHSQSLISENQAVVNIQRALDVSRYFLVVLTASWIEKEWPFYNGIFSPTNNYPKMQPSMISLLLEKCKIPEPITKFENIDFTIKEHHNQSWQDLLDILHNNGDGADKASTVQAGNWEVYRGVKVERDMQGHIIVGNNNVIQVITTGKTDLEQVVIPSPLLSGADDIGKSVAGNVVMTEELDSAYQLLDPNKVIPTGSRYYIERPADAKFKKAILGQESIITIRGGAQMGKSSLLRLGQKFAQSNGTTELFIDFNALERNTLNDLLRSMVKEISGKVNIDKSEVDSLWNATLPKQSFNDFMSDLVLPRIDKTILIMMDNVDSILNISPNYRQDFFRMIRSWHERIDWGKLKLVMAISTHPELLIEGPISPFNVGLEITLDDFDDAHINSLNLLYGSPASSGQIAQLKSSIGLHPFFVHMSLFCLRKGETLDSISGAALTDTGPFNRHLKDIWLKIHKDQQLQNSIKSIILKNKYPDDMTLYKLLGPGIVREIGTDRCEIRYPLYLKYLKSKFRL